MTSAESDALDKATREDGSVDHAVYEAEYKRGLRERQDRMVRESHDLWRAIEGWRVVETPEAFEAIVREAIDDVASGFFFIDRLGLHFAHGQTDESMRQVDHTPPPRR